MISLAGSASAVESERSALPAPLSQPASPRALQPSPEPRTKFSPRDWVFFLAVNSEEGRDWAERYRSGRSEQIDGWIQTALLRLREKQLPEARELLERAGAAVPDPTLSSIHSVLHHRYLAAWACLLYFEEDFDGAELYLDLANEEVLDVLASHRFLAPLADRCTDFRLQRIRISRNRRRWEEMEARIEIMRRTLHDEIPVCELADGREIRFSQLIRFFDGLDGLDDEAERAIHATFNVELRRRQFENLVPQLYLIPGFVIGYP